VVILLWSARAAEPLAELEQEVARLLLKGRAGEARQRLDQAGGEAAFVHTQEVLDDLNALVAAVLDHEEIIMLAFSADVGQDVTIKLLRSTVQGKLYRVGVKNLILQQDNGFGARPTNLVIRPGELANDEIMARLARSTHRWAGVLRGLRAWQWGQREVATECLKGVDEHLARVLLAQFGKG
jgi:hypothetical protein